jgi:hypothetical protein
MIALGETSSRKRKARSGPGLAQSRVVSEPDTRTTGRAGPRAAHRYRTVRVRRAHSTVTVPVLLAILVTNQPDGGRYGLRPSNTV